MFWMTGSGWGFSEALVCEVLISLTLTSLDWIPSG